MNRFVNRFYTADELDQLNRDIHVKYRLSDVFATHVPCMHSYRVKKGGRKEKEILENKQDMGDQNCSVCFKLRTCHVPDTVDVDFMTSEGMEDAKTIDHICKKGSFYDWLYKHEY
jgi:hypothetical protein